MPRCSVYAGVAAEPLFGRRGTAFAQGYTSPSRSSNSSHELPISRRLDFIHGLLVLLSIPTEWPSVHTPHAGISTHPGARHPRRWSSGPHASPRRDRTVHEITGFLQISLAKRSRRDTVFARFGWSSPSPKQPDGVMVAQQILILFVLVRIQVGLPLFLQ